MWGSQGCLMQGTRGKQGYGVQWLWSADGRGVHNLLPHVLQPLFLLQVFSSLSFDILSSLPSPPDGISYLLCSQHYTVPLLRVLGMILFLLSKCPSPPPISSSSSVPLANSSPACSLALPQLLLTNVRKCMICLLHGSFINLPALCSFNLEHKLPWGIGPCPLF